MNQAKKTITILGLQNTIVSTLTGPMDIFSLAGILWNQVNQEEITPFFDVKIASIDGKEICCHNNLIIKPHIYLEEIEHSDLIIIPSEDPNNLREDAQNIKPWVQNQFKKGAHLASVCTGSFLLAEMGYLDHKTATTHWGYAMNFRKRYPQVNLKAECLVTDEGNIFCGGGLHSYYDLSLYLIEKYCGYEIAHQCSQALVLDRSRDSQLPYAIFDFQKQHGDTAILQAQEWMERNFNKKINLDQISKIIAMGERNFKRRFKKAIGDSPMLYLQRLRIEKAKKSLSQTQMSVEEISGQVGYHDVSFFRQLFKKHVGISPLGFRKKTQLKFIQS